MKDAILFISALVGFTASFVRAEEVRGSNEKGTSEYRLSGDRSARTPAWHALWKGSLGGTTYSEGQDEGAAAFARFDARFEYPLLDTVDVVVEPGVDLFSSRLQERYDGGEYDSKFRANNFFIRGRLGRDFEARAGALSQEDLQNAMLISRRRAFPGVQGRARFPLGPLKGEFIVQSLVPTSYTLNAEREGKEALPTFQTQSLALSGEFGLGRFGVHLGHYAFANLPDKVAFQSAATGNTSNNGETMAGSRFAYGFDGAFAGADACICNLGPVGFELGYLVEQNMRAPSGYNRAQQIEIGPRLTRGDRILEVKYFNRFVESDATVSKYLPAWISGTNRVGDGVEARYALNDRHWILKADWVNNRTINQNDHQYTFSSLWLGVETAYAPF